MSTITKKKLKTKKGQRTFKKGPPAARIRSIGGISILDACMDPNLFRPWFAKPALKTWNSWFAFLNASFGLPMTPEQKQVYFDCTGRDKLLTRPVKEVYLCTGRRGGKSRVLALVAVYLACFYDWSPYLSPGEYGTIAIMASDRRQARTIFRYIYAFLTEVPLLKDRLAKEPTKESLELRGNIVIEIQTASYRSARGYALSLDTPIPTPKGFKPMGEIQVGDVVFDEYGKPTKVTAVFDRMPDKAYQLTFSDGSVIKADAEHQWVTWNSTARHKYRKLGLKERLGDIPPNWANWDCTEAPLPQREGKHQRCTFKHDFAPRTVNTEEIAGSLLQQATGYPNHAIPNCGPLQTSRKKLPLDPYLFGLWLGDGTSSNGTISGDFTNGDAQWTSQQFEKAGFSTRRCGEHSYYVRGLKHILRKMGALDTKHIPEEYLWASPSQRLALLQGFMDTDGFIDKRNTKQVQFTSVRKDHADAVAFLARSLGEKPTCVKRKKTEGYGGEPYFYVVRWYANTNPFRLKRRAERWEQAVSVQTQATKMRTIVGCEEIAPEPMRCITVASKNSMYLCGEALIPTHNTVIAALMDEIAFFRSDESSNPDTEILEAVLPGMSTIPHSMLLCASSPYARKGVLYQAYRDYFGKDDPNALFWKAPTWTMNPTIAPSIIERAYARDPAKASAEYGAEFRKDVETAISLEVIQAATDNGLEERLPSNAHHYVAFVDASGGSKDSFTMSIAHAEGEHRVIDYIYEKAPPFSPRDVIYEISSILKRYNISYVVGDRYAGEFPREHFRECGIMYETSSKPKSELYADFISMINSGQVRLLDNQKMARQFQELERKSRVGGRDVIDHPPGGHDDLANVVAGVCSCIDSVGLADIW